MAKLAAKTYSQALFEFALEAGKVDEIEKEFAFIVEAFTTYKEFFELFKTPKMSVDERKGIIKEIFSEKVSKEMMNFMMIILDKRRAGEILAIQREFEVKVDEYHGIVPAYVKSATELDESEKKAIVDQLKSLTGKEIRLKTAVDPSVIGGLYIKVGDKVIDGSIRKKLDAMREELRQIIV